MSEVVLAIGERQTRLLVTRLIPRSDVPDRIIPDEPVEVTPHICATSRGGLGLAMVEHRESGALIRWSPITPPCLLRAWRGLQILNLMHKFDYGVMLQVWDILNGTPQHDHLLKFDECFPTPERRAEALEIATSAMPRPAELLPMLRLLVENRVKAQLDGLKFAFNGDQPELQAALESASLVPD